MSEQVFNYVKFLRGSPEAYAALKPKDTDTLYFVHSEGASVGKIYLGEILVAGNVAPDGSNIVNKLEDLIDVNVAGLQSGKVLGYNGSEWVPMSLSEATSVPVMIGATADQAGSAGLVPAPQAGDQNKFLRGDGSWVEIADGNADLSNYATKQEVEVLENKIEEFEAEQDVMQDSFSWGTI